MAIPSALRVAALAALFLSMSIAPARAGRSLKQQLSGTSLLPGDLAAGAGDLVLTQALAPLDPRCAGYAHARYVRATTTQEMLAALSDARAGDLIELAPDTTFAPTVVDAAAPYGRWNATIVNKTGTPEAPIVVCGASSAVIDGSGFWTVDTSTFGNVHGFTVVNSSHVQLVGFTILRGGLTGVTISGSQNTLLDGLTISGVLTTAVRIRNVSTYNTVQNCYITDTGHRDPGIGEGVYIGTTPNPAIPPSTVDFSNYNNVLNNRFDHVMAEMVDAKANTRGGVIRGNYYDGTHLSGANGATKCIDIKGGAYTVTGNTCANMPKF